jgi:hypothetical protein
LAEVLTPREGQAPHPPQPLPLASAGVLRQVWESRFGPILIEVIGDQAFVNGALVERAPPPDLPPRAL